MVVHKAFGRQHRRRLFSGWPQFDGHLHCRFIAFDQLVHRTVDRLERGRVCGWPVGDVLGSRGRLFVGGTGPVFSAPLFEIWHRHDSAIPGSPVWFRCSDTHGNDLHRSVHVNSASVRAIHGRYGTQWNAQPGRNVRFSRVSKRSGA